MKHTRPQSRLLLSLLAAGCLSLPVMAADGPEPAAQLQTQGQTQVQSSQVETDRNTMHMTDAGADTGYQSSNTGDESNDGRADANDPDDAEKADSGGNFWLMMPLLLLGGLGMYFVFRRPVKKTVT